MQFNVHMLEPNAEKVPDTQAMHEEEPAPEEYVFATQVVHELAPGVAYVPDAHAAQLDRETAPRTEEYVPGKHDLQALDPTPAL